MFKEKDFIKTRGDDFTETGETVTLGMKDRQVKSKGWRAILFVIDDTQERSQGIRGKNRPSISESFKILEKRNN